MGAGGRLEQRNDHFGGDVWHHTPTTSDVGHMIKVKVSFTDFRGNAEGPLTSDAYPANGTVLAAASPCPAVNDWCATMTVADDEGDGVRLGY